ncbi:MAG: hypothetical protein ACE10B_02205, partial [Phycisphaerales bacterium]
MPQVGQSVTASHRSDPPGHVSADTLGKHGVVVAYVGAYFAAYFGTVTYSYPGGVVDSRRARLLGFAFGSGASTVGILDLLA